MKINPFETHPDQPPPDKKLDGAITLRHVRDAITDAIVHIRVEPAPCWGYNKHHITSILQGLIITLEQKCLDN